MKWVHKCSLDWMKARQMYLTASDIKELLPVTKTGKIRKVGDEQYIKVLARKQTMIYEDECISYGAAARGHILEPYAVRAFNARFPSEDKLLHWDDMIIARHDSFVYKLAFSPDACDIEQPDDPLHDVVSFAKPHVIGEIKSYSAERHLTCGITPPESLEERWQIATAMAVCPSIERAHIIFYHPSMRYQMFTHCYEREDLADEIQMVLNIEKDFNDFICEIPFKMRYIIGDENDDELRIMQSESYLSTLKMLDTV